MAIEHLFLHIVMNELREDPSTSPLIIIENPGLTRRTRRRVLAFVVMMSVNVLVCAQSIS